MTTPLLLIIYNRPKITSKQLQALAKIKPKKLYVFCDGSKGSKEKTLVLETRKLFEKLNWKTNIKINFQTKNLGCKKGVETALDWFFSNEDMGIILEDDCIPNEGFFKFTTELLMKYKTDTRISVVTGFNANNKIKQYKHSYYFSMYGGAWGWASWSDRWNEYRKCDIKNLIKNKELTNSLVSKGISKTYLNNVVLSANGSLDTWDYLWSFYNMTQNKLTIVPQNNLIINIGFGPDATHTKIESDLVKIEYEDLDANISHPNYFFPSAEIDNKRKLNHNKLYQLYRVIKNLFF